MQHHDNQQLQRVFAKRKSFFHDMEALSRRYLEFEQQVYYLPIKDINPDMIRKLDPAHDSRGTHARHREEIYIINGQYQPHGEKSFERLILQLVQTIPRPKTAFGIIYINTLAEGEAYNDFKKVLELLPIQYLVNLTKIYVLNASFFNKAFSWLSFGVAISFINKKTINVDDLRELSQESHVEMGVLKEKLPPNVIKKLVRSQHSHEQAPRGICIPEKESIDVAKSVKRDHISTNIFVGMARTSSADHPASEGHKIVPSGKILSDYELGPSGAPVILEMLICFFNNKEEYLKSEGLFRKSVSIEDEAEILQQLEKRNYDYLESVTDPHIIANAIKRFLCNLALPIIPYDIFEEFMAKDSSPQFKQLVVQRVKELPKVNRMIIFSLFDFLVNKVVPHSEHSKMGVNNLCIVFGPCLMRSEVASIKDLIFAKKIITVTNIIYLQFENIFGDRALQMKLKRSSYKEYRIEEMKQRESKDSRESPLRLEKGESSNSSEAKEEEEPRTPNFQTVSLINRASLFIKETLEKVESEDELEEEIEKEEPIEIPQQYEEISQQQTSESKVISHNLFITPTISAQPIASQPPKVEDKSGMSGPSERGK